MAVIRKAAFAGSFYPTEKERLKKMIDNFLKNANTEEIKTAKGFIVPHAGYIYSGQVAAYAYKIIKSLEAKRVILLGPSHFIPFIGSSISTADYWETPLGKVKVEKVKTKFIDFPAAHTYEHSIEVQLPFLQTVLKDFTIIPISIGDDYYKDIAKEIRDIMEGAIIIASSDLSHYHDYETAVKIDGKASKAITELDFKNAEKMEACGKIGILALMKIAKDNGWKVKTLFYANSGDVTGEKAQVVGYGCYAFYE
ncbi:MAG: AmmeMemoRadiSam system protein B [Candidatus Aenigmarchaeota archaeon]|nr:AmmeMemoRadiSam system protein B [Candidatus Aenigmarchaeota archaeon]